LTLIVLFYHKILAPSSRLDGRGRRDILEIHEDCDDVRSSIVGDPTRAAFARTGRLESSECAVKTLTVTFEAQTGEESGRLDFV